MGGMGGRHGLSIATLRQTNGTGSSGGGNERQRGEGIRINNNGSNTSNTSNGSNTSNNPNSSNGGQHLSRSFDEEGHLLGTSYDQETDELSVGSMSPTRRNSLTSLRSMVRSGATSVSEALGGNAGGAIGGRNRSYSANSTTSEDSTGTQRHNKRTGNASPSSSSPSSSGSSQQQNHGGGVVGGGGSGTGGGIRFVQSAYVQPYLDSIADDTPVYQMLKRLSPYFHGRHHVEEIMWRETVSRKAIQSVFATYTNILSTTLHPKAANDW
jgi:hypothetical protein